MRAFTRDSRLATRHALTLIELLVTIVIMVTVLAGVIPMLSPNNDARKIREAARELNSLFAQAQAQAARDGRPVGVAFREFGVNSPYSGMSLEAYLIAEPLAFMGFSEHSRLYVTNAGYTYGPATPADEDKFRFLRQFNNFPPVFTLHFFLPGVTPTPDFFPSRMLRIGDIVEVGGYSFLVCDDLDDLASPNMTEVITSANGNETEFLVSDVTTAGATPQIGASLDCLWLNPDNRSWEEMVQALGPPHLRTYKIRRQPANASDQPLQFPRAIGIDMQASGASGLNAPDSFDKGGPNTVGIMFAPHGAIEALYYDGERFDGVTLVALLLGRFENGNNGSQDANDFDFIANPAANADDLAQRRGRINWLNPDSMWVAVNRAGRVITSENATFDPTDPDFLKQVDDPDVDDDDEQFDLQRLAGAKYALEMSSMGGR